MGESFPAGLNGKRAGHTYIYIHVSIDCRFARSRHNIVNREAYLHPACRYRQRPHWSTLACLVLDLCQHNVDCYHAVTAAEGEKTMGSTAC